MHGMTAAPATGAPTPAPAEDMAWVPPGEFRMGSEDFYPEEAPVHPVTVDGFWMDAHPVTVREFRRFVKATGYVTVAERPLDADDYPDADPELLVPGSVVFRPTRGPVDLESRAWWSYVPGACWHRPDGPASDTYTRGRHPVTQVAYEDAEAYAEWAGKALPTEAEWERAARGGLDGKRFAWGDEETPGGAVDDERVAGRVPVAEHAARRTPGHVAGRQLPRQRLRAVRHDRQRVGVDVPICSPSATPTASRRPCCAPPRRAGERFPSRVIKGGSHLCAPSYCLRYRPAARQAEEIDTATTHLGFRLVVRP